MQKFFIAVKFLQRNNSPVKQAVYPIAIIIFFIKYKGNLLLFSLLNAIC